MTMQTLERQTRRRVPEPEPIDEAVSRQQVASELSAVQNDVLPAEFDLEAELGILTSERSEYIAEQDELGRRIMASAVSTEGDVFAVKCRSVSHATRFATPIRSMLLALTSGFGGISATVSPSLNLNTWPAMDMLVAALEQSGAEDVWQPIGERSIGVGASRHVFVSVDHPVHDDAARVFPNVLLEIVGAHLIDAEWFDRVVVPRCREQALTSVFYGQAGHPRSLFERALQESRIQGQV
jgi:hypothetical protein